MLEDKVLDSAGDNLEEFSNELLTLFERDVRFPAQALPEFLGAGDLVGVGFCGFAFGEKGFLFCVRFAGGVGVF